MARSKSVIQVLITGESRGLQRATASAGGALGGLAAGIVKVTAAAAGLAAGIGAIAVRAFASFDEEMTKATAIMGDLSDTMRNDLAEAAREVARTTTKSHEEAARSIYDLASAGLEAEQIIGVLPQVASFAEAGMMEMSTAAEQLAGAFFAMRMETGTAQGDMEQFTRITDVLTQANNMGAGAVEDFSAALTNKAGAAAALAGKDIEEVTAILVAFSKQNIIGQEAGERTSILFRDIARAAAINADEFARLGVEVFDANGNYKNMADVIGEFETLFTGMSDAQKASTLDQLGLTRSVADNIKALAGSSEMIREYEAELRNAGGTTEDVAQKQRDTLNAQLTILKNNLNDAAIELGSVLVPKILELFDALGGQEAVANLGENLTAAFEKFDEFISPFVDTIKNDVIPALKEDLPAALESLRPVLELGKSVFESIGNILRDTVIPAVGKLTDKWIELSPAVEKLVAFVRDIVFPVFESIVGIIFDVAMVLVDLLAPTISAIADNLDVLRQAWVDNKSSIQPLLDLLSAMWSFWKDKWIPILGDALGAIVGFGGWLAGKFFDQLGDVIDRVVRLVDWFRNLGRAANEASDAANNASSGGDGGLQTRAKGGPVSSNVPYWVGEQGPEVFVPRTAGYVLPNGWMSEVGTPVEFGSGGGVTIESGAVVVNLTMTGDGGDVARKVRREVDAALAQLARELAVS